MSEITWIILWCSFTAIQGHDYYARGFRSFY